MIISTLVENTSTSNRYIKKHGLCLHIETKNKRILFDLGPDDTFIKNATTLGIDIADVDIVIISHAHKDHGGGLEAFLKNNDNAKIYISKYALRDYFTSVLKYGKYYIGLDKELLRNDRIVFTDGLYKIDDNIVLFTNTVDEYMTPKSNSNLFIKEKNSYRVDDFIHEQNMILIDADKKILLSGCSHSGVLNIISSCEKIIGESVDYLIGGFHLYNPVSRKHESENMIEEICSHLEYRHINILTCHCTGAKAYKSLKARLNDKINDLSTGQIIKI